MEKKLLDYIQELSKRDKKSLSQKVSKLFEEGGELAKAVLPFESAYACRHRFSDKNKILEQVADTILSAISIAYDIGCSHDEIEDMIDFKSEVWQGLQAKEEDAKFPLPYEIHVTVERDEDKNFKDFADIFKIACKKIGVKSIVLDLENKDGVLFKDAMTSSKIYGDNTIAYNEMQRIAGQLKRLGYNVVRQKIETVPWHPAAPTKESDLMPKNCYFESHISVEIDGSDEMKRELSDIASRLGAHLSRNMFKKIDEGKYIVMLTLRDYHVKRSEFESIVKNVVSELKANGWILPKKEVIEFATYDTKISHDYLWLK